MKLKYLLRGIGIGFFTAGLIALLVTLGGGKMSDEEVIKRAEELGYVSADAGSESSEIVKLTDQTPINSTKEDGSEKSIAEEIIPGGIETSEETTEVSDSEDAKKAEEEQKKAEEEKKKAEEEAKKQAEEEEKKKAEEEAKKKAEEEQKKAEEEKKKAEEEAKKQEQVPTGETVTITVKSGQFSESVAKACEQAGLVTSAAEFDSFLCKNGYANRISVGDHVIAKGASFEEIAKALCK